MVGPLNDSARKRIVRCEVPALVSMEAEYWQTATQEQRRREETTAAKRFIATSLAKSVDKYGARIKTGRILGNDWVVRHDNRYFQVHAQSRQYAPAKGKVTVSEWEDGRLQIRYRGRAVSWEEITGPVPAEAVRTSEAKAQKQKPPTPRAEHPWRQAYRKMRPWSKPGQVPLLQEISGCDRP
jgi:hypothetical protein